jgi:hypothetical protein
VGCGHNHSIKDRSGYPEACILEGRGRTVPCLGKLPICGLCCGTTHTGQEFRLRIVARHLLEKEALFGRQEDCAHLMHRSWSRNKDLRWWLA